jgi:Zn-dependent M16 (insulinase) family peptidase
MQGRENQSSDLIELANIRLMFPASSGYRSQTGGLMENLRVLKVETIREYCPSCAMELTSRYHANYYVPHNLTLVIVGEVDHGALLHTLQNEVESSILAKGKTDLSHWKRPWVASPPVPPLKSSHSKVVTFPDEDESMGLFSFNCFGPEYEVYLPQG